MATELLWNRNKADKAIANSQRAHFYPLGTITTMSKGGKP